MRQSEQIGELALALVKAQFQVKPALKDSANPYFKSKYADFASVLDACEEALFNNGLAIIQAPISSELGAGVDTILMHGGSGQWIAQEFILPASAAKSGELNAQGYGSCITYARRYALEGFMRIKREDDDGNAAARSRTEARQHTLVALENAASQGIAALETAWKALSRDQRVACTNDLPGLKEKANARISIAATV